MEWDFLLFSEKWSRTAHHKIPYIVQRIFNFLESLVASLVRVICKIGYGMGNVVRFYSFVMYSPCQERKGMSPMTAQ